ncbi:hypothetical protein L6452_29710 [Arctium lappa]|uniref:Uncharacterized protein n=1 Tax=Arctium lappa TaxID=4217 RepID=A0ACB8ZI61_ARCLA|nr:hypothetical protein L6452_29710 [Arctium lappa]
MHWRIVFLFQVDFKAVSSSSKDDCGLDNPLRHLEIEEYIGTFANSSDTRQDLGFDMQLLSFFCLDMLGLVTFDFLQQKKVSFCAFRYGRLQFLGTW